MLKKFHKEKKMIPIYSEKAVQNQALLKGQMHGQI